MSDVVCPRCGKAHTHVADSRYRVSCDVCERAHRMEDVCFILVPAREVLDDATAAEIESAGYRVVKVFPRLLTAYKPCQFVRFGGWPEGSMDGQREAARLTHTQFMLARERRRNEQQ